MITKNRFKKFSYNKMKKDLYQIFIKFIRGQHSEFVRDYENLTSEAFANFLIENLEKVIEEDESHS